MAGRIDIPGIKDAIKDWQGFRKEVNGTAKELLSLIQSAEKTSSAFRAVTSLKEFNEFTKQSAESTRKTAMATDQLTDSQKKLLAANKQLNVALSKEAQEIQKARVETSRLNRTSRQLAVISSELSTEYEKQSARLQMLRKRQKDLNTQAELGTKLNKTQRAELKRLNKEVLSLDASLKKVDAQAGQFQRNVGNYPKLFGGIARSAKALASNLGLVGGSLLIASGIRDAVRTLIQFDKQLIAVGKTTNLSGDELNAFGKEVVTLGVNTRGVSIEGLLKSAEVAGQLGIRGTQNILKFSQTIEQLGKTSDVVGEDSVRNFAKFIEVSNDTVENSDRLGSVITQLGNNFATTENQVLTNSTEIQKGIAIYESSAESVLALGAATSSLGLQAEQARSGIQSTFQVLEDAANGGDSLNEVLKVTGLTQAELSKQFRTDATGVFQLFVKGLKDIRDEGGSVTSQLKDLDLNNKQSINTLGALAKNYETLEDALGQANKAYIENVALTEEAEAATQSISSRLGDIEDAWDGFILAIDSGTGKLSNAFRVLADLTEGALKGLRLLNLSEKDRTKAITEQIAAEERRKFVQDDIRAAALFSGKAISEEAQERADEIADEIDDLEALQAKRQENRKTLQADIKEVQADLKDAQKDLDAQGFTELFTDQEPSQSVRQYQAELKELERALEGVNKDLQKGNNLLIIYRAEEQAAEDLQNDISGTITPVQKEIEDQKELIKEQRKGAKERLKDAFNLAKQRLQFEIETNEAISENELESLQNRLGANQNVSELTQDLIELERMFAVKNAKGRTEEITRINEDAQNKLTELTQEGEAQRDDILQDNFDREFNRIMTLQEEGLSQLDVGAAELRKKLQDQGKSTREIEEEVTEFLREERKKQIEEQIDLIGDQLSSIALTADERKAIEEELTALKLELLGIEDEAYQESEEKRREAAERTKEAILSTLDTIGNAISQSFENRITLIENQIQADEEAQERRLENFNGTEEQRAEIEEAGEARRQQLENKKRQEQQRQSRFEKAQAIVQTAINTAQSITKTSAQLGFPAALPFVALAAAQGAIQTAVIASQPIPAFAKGKKKTDGYKGTMLWGEVQPEIKKDKRGNLEVAMGPTIGFTEPGDTIYPSFEAFHKENQNFVPQLADTALMAMLSKGNDQKSIDNYIMALGSQVNSGIKKGFKGVKVINQQKSNNRFERISKKVSY